MKRWLLVAGVYGFVLLTLALSAGTIALLSLGHLTVMEAGTFLLILLVVLACGGLMIFAIHHSNRETKE